MVKHLQDCDEIWHAGDIGSIECADTLEALGPTLRMVWGNIDEKGLRLTYEQDLFFDIDGLMVYMTHIGGYPGRYYQRPLQLIRELKPDLFVCGHSHILKVMPDKTHKLLHMNPGACGVKGFHKFRTLLKFDIENKKITNLRAVELELRGQKTPI